MDIRPYPTNTKIKVAIVATATFLLIMFVGGGFREPVYETFLAASIVSIIVFVVGLISVLPDMWANRVRVVDGTLIVKTLFSTKEIKTKNIFSIRVTRYGERNPFYSMILFNSYYRKQFMRLTIRTRKKKVHIPYQLYKKNDIKKLIKMLKLEHASIQLYLNDDHTINPSLDN